MASKEAGSDPLSPVMAWRVASSLAISIKAKPLRTLVRADPAHHVRAWDQPAHAGASLAGNDSSDASRTASSGNLLASLAPEEGAGSGMPGVGALLTVSDGWDVAWRPKCRGRWCIRLPPWSALLQEV